MILLILHAKIIVSNKYNMMTNRLWNVLNQQVKKYLKQMKRCKQKFKNHKNNHMI